VATCLGLDDVDGPPVAVAAIAWRDWCLADPELAVVDDVRDLPAWTRAAPTLDKDRVLAQLLARAHDGTDAATVLAWLLVPGATRLADNLRNLSPDIDALTAGELWLQVSKPTVIGWKRRYATEGIGGLEDRPKPGRPKRVGEVAVVLATLELAPDRLGVTHWSSRLLADELGISHVWVSKIWRRWGLQPWRTETFKFSTDPQLEAKIRDIVGLYLHPPENAIVLCVDESGRAGAR
jgi:transposase